MSLLYFDGGASPNPGAMHVCVVLDGKTYFEKLGQGTNNVAEWLALCWGLSIAKADGVIELEVIGDSQLIINQANGLWKIKKEEFRPFKAEFVLLAKSFTKLTVRYEPRDKNLAGKHIESVL